MFDHFMGLALKWLRAFKRCKNQIILEKFQFWPTEDRKM